MPSRKIERAITYIAMDVGNVLVRTDHTAFIQKLSKTFNITLEDALFVMNSKQKLHDLGHVEMANDLKERFGIKSQLVIDDLIASWNNIIDPANYVIDFLMDLADEHCLKIALLSNVGVEHSKQMENVLSYRGFFQKAVKHLSCEVGARKPTVLYYQSFLQLHPEWQGSLYIDDVQENLDASKQFGFETFRFALNDWISLDDLKTAILRKNDNRTNKLC